MFQVIKASKQERKKETKKERKEKSSPHAKRRKRKKPELAIPKIEILAGRIMYFPFSPPPLKYAQHP